MPRNLVHSTGEFYTPAWLAELLLADSGWKPGQTLIDPFAGSGVFLLAALRRGQECGHEPLRLLSHLAAIDRNPVACVAARTNLILHLADDIARARHPVALPVACADSLLDDAAKLSAPADVLVTNPPWVGWEYLPRGYRSQLDAAWRHYGLFTAKGRDAAFLKEDLSTLALVSAWDRFLKPGGTSAVVLRPAAMQSHLAARGLRRLSLFPDSGPLALRLIRLFPGLRAFGTARAPAASWCLTKGQSTRFPVRVVEYTNGTSGRILAAAPSSPAGTSSAWTIGNPEGLVATAALTGSNDYQVRTGVFTGGANAVYYVERVEAADRGVSRYRNIAENARRSAPVVECLLEDALVYEVVRGRDLGLWQATPGAHLLCPHTAATRMHAIARDQLTQRYPNAFRYLTRMRDVLDARLGFSGWEQAPRQAAFYALQRIGAYTFLPYKVAWRYIATDFLVAVIEPGQGGRPRFCNDKVMFVGCAAPQEAYFLCGLLSSDPVRWCVTATMTGTQISVSAIKHLKLPAFDPGDRCHLDIAEHCQAGHRYVGAGEMDSAQKELDRINRVVAKMYGLSQRQIKALGGLARFS
jgi:hypothetical protein